jgi:hypothetical protein
MDVFSKEQVVEMRQAASKEVADILQKLNNDFPGVTEGLAAAVGSTAGAGGSFIALTLLGVKGLSAAGITSGLATAGGLVGGGMVAGIGVLAAPVAVAGILAYAIARQRRSAKLAAALNQAIVKLYEVQERLMANAEYFTEELAVIKTTLNFLKEKQIK